LFIPMGFEYGARRAFDAARASPEDMVAVREEALFDLSDEIRQSIELAERQPSLRGLRTLGGGTSGLMAFLRTRAPDVRDSHEAELVLINADLRRPMDVDISLSPLPPAAGAAWRVKGPQPERLQPGEVQVLPCGRTADIESGGFALQRAWAEGSRIAIEDVQPTVTGGDFPAKTIVGRVITVSADIIGDGHDILGAEVLWRPADETDWRRVRMTKGDNDRWHASWQPDRVGLHQFAVEGWWDQWASYAHDLHAKVAAGQTVSLEIQEGRTLIEHAAMRVSGALQTQLTAVLAKAPDAEALLAPALEEGMRQADDHPLAARSAVYQMRVDRPAAEFASWYELFPRSETHDAAVHGTFQSVIARLSAIKAMGFDVLYFPPINPIGRVNRKGKNNSLRAEEGDVGSPYAIGGEAGGHDAVHPALGTLEDFQALQQAAHENGLELAVDFAIQCAPDHPWIAQHKDWFRWRPDGSMRYAENPPKKYEDIVNPDFWSDAAFPGVWEALRDVIRFWVDHGIRIFRVDNPHTKPLPFWQWMIADIQRTDPDVLFLSEAFTRPKLMYRLAKVGFSQSYTYFTWRNTKQEITEYLTEITAAPVADFFRPNFFVNTPDINPVFLQNSGRPGFLIRAALAATLSGLWGVYSGFEICESAPLPGREEYLDSEKYEIRPRNYQAPGNIVAEITALNMIRRRHPALQSHLGLRFYAAANSQIILYGKADPDGGGIILVAVSFDPYNVQEADIEIPLWDLDLPDHAAVSVQELMRGYNFTWHGKYQHIRLDPFDTPFYIWQLSRVGAN
jgi:starch synthase (maltosyl-transferring)